MKKIMLLFVITVALLTICFTREIHANRQRQRKKTLPEIETFVVLPPDIENLYVWVPADKVGPLINRACRAKENCSYAKSLPADVCHDKEEGCPEIVARLLARMVSILHKDVLPLTIFNGWQWEYSYSMADYDAKVYELPARGGAWENCSEAIYLKTFGKIIAGWITPSCRPDEVIAEGYKSNITVETFTNMRTRNGYPSQKQLK